MKKNARNDLTLKKCPVGINACNENPPPRGRPTCRLTGSFFGNTFHKHGISFQRLIIKAAPAVGQTSPYNGKICPSNSSILFVSAKARRDVRKRQFLLKSIHIEHHMQNFKETPDIKTLILKVRPHPIG